MTEVDVQKTMPTLQTDRLTLRPFALTDCDTVQLLAGAKEVATTTKLIPHPYTDDAAGEWIATHQPTFAEGKGISLAIAETNGDQLVGAISLGINIEANHAELGYWVGVPAWGKGYCTEAAHAMLAWGFEERKLNRIHAHFMGSNGASGRVMEKIGMQYEGTLRQHIAKWDRVEDAILYGILRDEYCRMTH